MKGSGELLDLLNRSIARELQVSIQYMWQHVLWKGVKSFAVKDELRKIAVAEMKHAEKLIERIIFLEGKPIVSQLNPMHIGAEVPKMMENDLAAEMGAVKGYNTGVKVAVEAGDNATREILEGILKDEDDHVDDIESHRDEIEQMGLQIFLSTQK